MLFDADADATTPADAATPTDASTTPGRTGTNFLARIVRTEVAEAVESFAVDVAPRAETKDRLRDAESKLEVALEAARAAELAAARAGDADASIASLREQLERANERSERADAERRERETRSAEAHERSVARLRRDWEARVGEARGDLANARSECDRRVADAEKEAARLVAEARLERTQAEARAQIAETRATAAKSEAEREAARARELEAGFERRVERIEREHRVVLAEKDRECVWKDAEVSNHLARVLDAWEQGDRQVRLCLVLAAAIKVAEAKASRCDELERANGARRRESRVGKTAAIVAEVRAHLNARSNGKKTPSDARRRRRGTCEGARRVGRPESGSRAGDEHARRRSRASNSEKKTPR